MSSARGMANICIWSAILVGVEAGYCGASSGPQDVTVGSEVLTLHCEVGSDGDWLLVHIGNARAMTPYDKYPYDGQNYGDLAADGVDLASISVDEMRKLWLSMSGAVMKLESRAVKGSSRSLPISMYIQRTDNEEFNPFLAIRSTWEWGDSYNLCDSPNCYNADTRVVSQRAPTWKKGRMYRPPTHTGDAEMVADGTGATVGVSSYGIPWDATDSCEWISHNHPTPQVKAFCADSNTDVLTKIYVSAPPFTTTATATATATTATETTATATTATTTTSTPMVFVDGSPKISTLWMLRTALLVVFAVFISL